MTLAEKIRRTDLYLSRDLFTAAEMAEVIGERTQSVARALNQMRDDGQADVVRNSVWRARYPHPVVHGRRLAGEVLDDRCL